jgi:hypothetical protein
MAKVRINGDTSGYIELASPAAAGSNTITLPSSNGSANQLLKNSGTAGTLDWSTLTEDSSGNLNIDSGTLYVDATNNRVGVGTTSPGHALHVSNGNDSASGEFVGITIGGTNSGNARTGSIIKDTTTFDLIYRNQNFSSALGAHVFRNGPSEHARIDSSGRLLVGTSSSRSNNLFGESQTQIEGTTSPTSSISVIRNSTNAASGGICLAKTRGSSAGSATVVQSGDPLGFIDFEGADGTSLKRAASIACEVDATPGTNDMPGRLVFSTTADGASSPTERLRINSSGQILVNTTSASSGGFVSTTFFVVNSGGAPCAGFRRSDSSGTNEYIRFTDGDDTDCGSIDVNATANTTAYTTSSDYRLKQNVQPLQNTVARLKSLKPCSWEWINAPGVMGEGFIAHEAQAVVPESVTGAKDEVDADGKPIYQGIDQSKLVPLLTAALQEAIQKIQQLETLNASFEARLAALEVKP